MQNGTCVTKLQPSNRSGDDTKLVTLSLAGQYFRNLFVCSSLQQSYPRYATSNMVNPSQAERQMVVNIVQVDYNKMHHLIKEHYNMIFYNVFG